MKKVLTDEATRERLERKGRLRAKRFSWEEAVAQIQKTYMTALA